MPEKHLLREHRKHNLALTLLQRGGMFKAEENRPASENKTISQMRPAGEDRPVKRFPALLALSILLFLSLSVLLISPAPGHGEGFSDSDIIEVSGTGYPPIKAQSAAQARLMARRAAILDAYRNALAATGSSGSEEPMFYEGLSGFVRGLTIEKEEYLEDGGVRIRAKTSGRSLAVAVRPSRESLPEKARGGPSPVPLNEWYRIIEGSVRFE
jgi:hypothetical protein